MNDAVFQSIRNSRLFSNIAEKDFPMVLGCIGAAERKYLKSEFIFLEGEEMKKIGLLLSGSVQMIKEDVWGDKMILTEISKGEIFGESFVCNEQIQSTVSFQAVEDGHVLLLPFHRLFTTCARACSFHHALVENMVVLIAEKNVAMMDKMAIISKKTIRERILVWMSQQIQRSGKNQFVSSMGRLDLAEYLCVDRSALSRELSNMKRDGLIDFEKDRFVLTN